jgi:hypothetical protein
MLRPIWFFALVVLTASNLCAEAFLPPIFLADRTVEYRPGNLPIVVGAPHGGKMTVPEIPDRTSGVRQSDVDTDLLARALGDALQRQTGASPHLIICHLKRSKVDCNRDALTGTGGNPQAQATWQAFHEAIAKARARAGRGVYLDLHGHGHPDPRVEIGYLLSGDQLRLQGEAFEKLASVSSLAGLARKTGTRFEDLVRGPQSLGALLEAQGFLSVPSPSRPSPGGQPYYPGGFNTERYRTGNGFLSLQIECPRPGIRDTETNRERFAEALAKALLRFLETHADLSLQGAVTR